MERHRQKAEEFARWLVSKFPDQLREKDGPPSSVEPALWIPVPFPVPPHVVRYSEMAA